MTIEDVLTSMDEMWTQLQVVLEQLVPVLDKGPDAGGWTPRQVLAHILGSLQRISFYSAYFLSNKADVPVFPDDPYWLPEYEHAPLEAFVFTLKVVHEGNRLFVCQLSSADLAKTARTPFGVTELGRFLVANYSRHIAQTHIPQLAGFLNEETSLL
jgi:hypothetical protein